MIYFKNIRWKNFLSTGNNFTDIQLDRQKSTLIVGENGSGKSTILDALCFALFGKPFRVISKSQLVNTVNNTDCVVEIEFRVGTKEWKIVRGIKPNKFEIYCDDVMINQEANSRDYQKYLEQQVLKLNYRSFTQVVILGNASFTPFMQLKAIHRREIVEEILDIKIFSLMNLILKTKLKDLTDEVKDLDYQFNMAVEKIALQENFINDIKEDKDEIVKDKEKTLSENEDILSERKDENDILEKQIEDLKSKIKDEAIYDEKLKKLRDIKSTLTEKHKQLTKELVFFAENQNCPTCLQDIQSDHKDEMVKERQTKVTEIAEGSKKLKVELDEVKKQVKEIDNAMQVIRGAEASRAGLLSSIVELEKYNAKLKADIQKFKDGKVSEKDEVNLRKMKDECKGVEATRLKVKEEMTYVNTAREILNDTGIKTKIIKQYLPIMNQLINKYLMSMDFYVNFHLDENFTETIKSRFRDTFNYASFSEGEKMRIDLAILFTWRAVAKMKNSTNTNLLILDEIFDSSLDGTGTEEFLRILNTLEGENTFVISHKGDQLADKFRNSIRFEKVQNFSRIM
tara:strand:- start:13196 stop:14902 length:1707 start_codon:yes stop_codon:yes gene_type:complete